jgi:hypothetical protein
MESSYLGAIPTVGHVAPTAIAAPAGVEKEPTASVTGARFQRDQGGVILENAYPVPDHRPQDAAEVPSFPSEFEPLPAPAEPYRHSLQDPIDGIHVGGSG